MFSNDGHAASAVRVGMRVLFAVLLVSASAKRTAGKTINDHIERLPGVVVITPDNIDSHVNGTTHALVKFYAPWCGPWCFRLVPGYAQLAELVAATPELASHVIIANVNHEAHPSLYDKFGIRGLPTVLFLPRGKTPTAENGVVYHLQYGFTPVGYLKFLMEMLTADEFVGAEDEAATVAALASAVETLEAKSKRSDEL